MDRIFRIKTKTFVGLKSKPFILFILYIPVKSVFVVSSISSANLCALCG